MIFFWGVMMEKFVPPDLDPDFFSRIKCPQMDPEYMLFQAHPARRNLHLHEALSAWGDAFPGEESHMLCRRFRHFESLLSTL